ncbi:MFS transporter [Nonomuraea sp. NPDC049141]|uniref:MFS transporter n=1 Tax=Nonomuraea sp. NPDC049141 TaxID=3155500 RepID=UPI0033D200AD
MTEPNTRRRASAPPADAEPPRPPSGMALLRHVSFLLLWLALVQSALGDQLYRVGLSWYSTNVLGGVMDTALIGVALAVPMAVLGLAGGVIVDRVDRFRLLVSADLVRLVVTTLLAVALAAQTVGITGLVVGTIVLSIPAVVFMPAVQTVLPELAGGDFKRLVRMDSLIIGSFNVVTVVGATLSGALLAVVPVGWLLGADAVTFAVSAVLILLVARTVRTTVGPRTQAGPAKKARSLSGAFSDAVEGLRYIWRDKVLRPQFLVYPVLDGAQYSIIFLLPAFLAERGDPSTLLYGVAVAAMGAGRVIGLLLISHTFLMERRGIVLAANFIVQGLAVLMIVAVPAPWIAPLAMALVGIPAGAATIGVASFVQTTVPKEVRGRVMAGVMSLSSSLTPVGVIVLGALAGATSSAAALGAVAAVFVVGGAYIAAQKAIRALR